MGHRPVHAEVGWRSLWLKDMPEGAGWLPTSAIATAAAAMSMFFMLSGCNSPGYCTETELHCSQLHYTALDPPASFCVVHDMADPSGKKVT
jgi:hypothetical protein